MEPSISSTIPPTISSSSTTNSKTSSKKSSTRKFIFSVAISLVLLVAPQLFAQQPQYNGQYTADQPSAPPGYSQPPEAQKPDAGVPYSAPQSAPDAAPQYNAPEPPPQADPAPQTGPPPQAAVQPLGAQDLQQLVAPIALYPDALVAQILAAATYPAQVADADGWRHAQGYASSDQIAAGADAQSWDPSVKALTAFPQVLAQMSRNLHWTSDLGNAYYNQPQDVMEAVQVMRSRAQQAGNLRSTPQESVSYDQGNIVLAPANQGFVCEG